MALACSGWLLEVGAGAVSVRGGSLVEAGAGWTTRRLVPGESWTISRGNSTGSSRDLLGGELRGAVNTRVVRAGDDLLSASNGPAPGANTGRVGTG